MAAKVAKEAARTDRAEIRTKSSWLTADSKLTQSIARFTTCLAAVIETFARLSIFARCVLSSIGGWTATTTNELQQKCSSSRVAVAAKASQGRAVTEFSHQFCTVVRSTSDLKVPADLSETSVDHAVLHRKKGDALVVLEVLGR